MKNSAPSLLLALTFNKCEVQKVEMVLPIKALQRKLNENQASALCEENTDSWNGSLQLSACCDSAHCPTGLPLFYASSVLATVIIVHLEM